MASMTKRFTILPKSNSLSAISNQSCLLWADHGYRKTVTVRVLYSQAVCLVMSLHDLCMDLVNY